MQRYYYTYGCDPDEQAFFGGWTEVIAENRAEADRLYTAIHPMRNGFIPCAMIYGEAEFKKTRMYREGNFGHFLHETIEHRASECVGNG